MVHLQYLTTRRRETTNTNMNSLPSEQFLSAVEIKGSKKLLFEFLESISIDFLVDFKFLLPLVVFSLFDRESVPHSRWSSITLESAASSWSHATCLWPSNVEPALIYGLTQIHL